MFHVPAEFLLSCRSAVVAVVTASALTSALALPGVAAAAPAPHRSTAPHGSTVQHRSADQRRPAAQPHASAPAHQPGGYVAVSQFRALKATTVGAGHRVTVKLGGLHAIPANASAVALTVHAISPHGDGMLTAVPYGAAAPKAITVSYRSGQNTAQPTVTRLAHGAVSIVNRARSGSTRVAVDVSGYYGGGTVSSAQPGNLHMLTAPTRALDTRGHTPLRAHGVRTFKVGHGVPGSGVGAVAIALSTFNPTAGGALIAYAAGNDQPTSPSATFAARRTTTTFAWVPTHSDGSISVANDSDHAVAFAVDVVGWVNTGVARQAGAFEPRFPARLVNHSPMLAGRTRTVQVAGNGGVPLAGVRAALVQLTSSAATRAGSLIAWPGGTAPSTRVVDYGPGRTVSSVAEVPLSGRSLRIKNVSQGSMQLTVDVVGFVLGTTLTPPPTSISRYLGDLTGDASDLATMHNHGCSDATAMQRRGSRFVLLDVGAQSVTRPELSPDNPGVSLTEVPVGTTVRLTYPELVVRLQSYLDAFAQCGENEPATIAIGTSNDGAWDPNGDNYYAPAARGADWAGSVVNMLTTDPGLTFAGAADIEPGFASTQTQALTWEKNYLRAVTADRATLVFNGSADGCPDGFGVANTACDNSYTQQGLYRLAHYNDQVLAVPQIYGPSMAAQWANIDSTGGGGIVFGGALTEHALADTTYKPANGWAALHHAIGTLTRSPSLPAVSDITNG